MTMDHNCHQKLLLLYLVFLITAILEDTKYTIIRQKTRSNFHRFHLFRVVH